MYIQLLLIILGLALLIAGAYWLVNGASLLAKKFQISELVIGLTIVAFGTSAPELAVNITSSINGLSDIVYGNILGSNIFNLLIILGIVGLIRPINVKTNIIKKELPFSLFAILALFFLSKDFFINDAGTLSEYDSFFLLFCFCGFIFYIYKLLKSEPPTIEVAKVETKIITLAIFIIGGLAALIFGGRMVVTNAVLLANEFGVSDKIIGLTILAVGTSLPELITSVVAAIKKNSDIAIGNVIGSNIFNVLFVIPISGMINPTQYNAQFDMTFYFIIGGTILLYIAMFTGGRAKLDRWEAGILILMYIAYFGWQIV